MANNLQNVWGWLMSLDQPTRAAIIGGLATVLSVFGALLGVYLNLAWNRKQHRDEKSYNLRRDVYLDAIALVNRAVGSLGAFPNEDTKESDDKLVVSRELLGACAKVRVLGGKRVIAAIIDFESSFEEWSRKFAAHETLYEQGGERQEEHRKEIDRLGKLFRTSLPQRDQVARIIDEFDLSSSDPEALKKARDAVALWKELKAKWGEIEKQLDSIGTAVATTATERYQALASSLDYILELPTVFDPLLHEITVAMKMDLGLPINEHWYKDKMQVAADRLLRSTKDYMENHPTVKKLRSKLEAPSPSVANTAAQDKSV